MSSTPAECYSKVRPLSSFVLSAFSPGVIRLSATKFSQLFYCSSDTPRKSSYSDWWLVANEWNQMCILTPSIFLSNFLEVSTRNPCGVRTYIIIMLCLYYQLHSRRIRLSNGKSPTKDHSRGTCIYLGVQYDTTANASE